jgi:hypothetical protein
MLLAMTLLMSCKVGRSMPFISRQSWWATWFSKVSTACDAVAIFAKHRTVL